jgi:F-type H+-transporting ATPase subunit delta
VATIDPAARAYADALYEAAQEAGRLDAVRKELSAFLRALAESHQLARAMFNPAFPNDAKQRIVAQVLTGADELVPKAINVMLENGRITLLPDMEAAFAERYEKEQRELTVTLTTAIALDDTKADEVRSRLQQATGQNITLKRVVDPAILGGVVLRMRDQMVDASVRRRLEGLRRRLTTVRLPS